MTRQRKYFRRQTGIIMYYNSKVENCQAFFSELEEKNRETRRKRLDKRQGV